jgi:hypothetical protein
MRKRCEEKEKRKIEEGKERKWQEKSKVGTREIKSKRMEGEEKGGKTEER